MSLFLINNLNAKDYLFEAYGVSELSTIEISDNFKFSAYKSEGMWDDNNGDYGNEKCSGYLKQKNKKVELEIFCETINQNNEKFWNSRIRKSDKGGGIGGCGVRAGFRSRPSNKSSSARSNGLMPT